MCDVACPLPAQEGEVSMLLRTIGRLRGLLRDEIGQDLMEYALLASLIAVAFIGALRAVGTEVTSLWSDIATGIAIF